MADDADLSCPSGGDFYTCTTGSMFLGCCNSDPCSSGCPSNDLTAASFNGTYSQNFPDQTCSPGALFYTCRDTTTPFIGCCSSDPCQAGSCASSDLQPAYLNDAAAASDFPLSSTSTSSSSRTRTSTSSSASRTASSSSSASAIPAPDSGSDVPLGAIIGGAVGGLVLLIAIIAFVLLCLKRRRNHRNQHVSDVSTFLAARKSTPSNASSATRAPSSSFNTDQIWAAAALPKAPSPTPAQDRTSQPQQPGRVSDLPPDFILSRSQGRLSPSPMQQLHSPQPSELMGSPTTRHDRWSSAPSNVSELSGSEPLQSHRVSLGPSPILQGRESWLRVTNPDPVMPAYPGAVRYQAYRPST